MQKEVDSTLAALDEAKKGEQRAEEQVVKVRNDLREEAKQVADLRQQAEDQLEHTRHTESQVGY